MKILHTFTQPLAHLVKGDWEERNPLDRLNYPLGSYHWTQGKSILGIIGNVLETKGSEG